MNNRGLLKQYGMAKAEKRGPYKDGYYIEVHNSINSQPVLIHRENQPEIQQALQLYGSSKTVRYIGEVKSGKILQL